MNSGKCEHSLTYCQWYCAFHNHLNYSKSSFLLLLFAHKTFGYWNCETLCLWKWKFCVVKHIFPYCSDSCGIIVIEHRNTLNALPLPSRYNRILTGISLENTELGSQYSEGILLILRFESFQQRNYCLCTHTHTFAVQSFMISLCLFLGIFNCACIGFISVSSEYLWLLNMHNSCISKCC